MHGSDKRGDERAAEPWKMGGEVQRMCMFYETQSRCAAARRLGIRARWDAVGMGERFRVGLGGATCEGLLRPLLGGVSAKFGLEQGRIAGTGAEGLRGRVHCLMHLPRTP